VKVRVLVAHSAVERRHLVMTTLESWAKVSKSPVNQEAQEMNFKDLMQELKSLGSEQFRKTYRRHGVQGEIYGVSFANYGALKKKIKIDHELAVQLWKSGNHDARILATMIADPAKGIGLLDEWVNDLNSYVIIDAVATFASQTSIDPKKVERWMKSKDEWIGCFGWSLFARLVRVDSRFPDESLETYLEVIERDIHKAKNRVKHSMNSALISIGVRDEKLQKEALAAAARIGKVEVDHGDTDCKTPAAAQYILKTVARPSKPKAAKAT
jgi:3-methyladenine DNA glycosylase AlkD